MYDVMKDGKEMSHVHQLIDVDEQPLHNDIEHELSELCELTLRSFLL